MMRIPLVIGVVLSFAVPLMADDQPTTNPSPATAAATPSTQPDVDAIAADLDKAFQELHADSVPISQLFSADGRKQAAPKMIPSLKKVMVLLNKLAATSDDAASQVADTIPQVRLRLLILGDPDTTAELQNQVAGKDAAAADEAKAELATAAFFVAHGDAAGQLKALDQFAASMTDKANQSVIRWVGMLAEIEPASPDVSTQLIKVIKDNVPEPDADQMIEQITDSQKLAALVNKPLVVTGSTVDGKPFTTADWKGKVVMLDFWATWCQPCVEEMPHVKKLYDQYHPQGFEIVGVSNDFAAADITKFTADNQMAWPQLFDPTNAAKQDWNSISHNLGVDAIPEMILIDKNGTVRSVEGMTDADDLLPKLLAEPAGK